MNRSILFAAFLAAILFAGGTALVACGAGGGESADGHEDHGHGEDGHDDHDDHGHGEDGDAEEGHDDHGHDDHGHGHGDEDAHATMPREALGSLAAGSFTVTVTQLGHVEPNEELIFEIEIEGGDVSGVTGWYGGEDRSMSRTAAAHEMGDGWDLHLEPMAELPEGGKLYLAIATADGEEVVSFDGHMAHEGHEHDHDHDDHGHDDHDHDDHDHDDHDHE